jgi:hypothetical protein
MTKKNQSFIDISETAQGFPGARASGRPVGESWGVGSRGRQEEIGVTRGPARPLLKANDAFGMGNRSRYQEKVYLFSSKILHLHPIYTPHRTLQ